MNHTLTAAAHSQRQAELSFWAGAVRDAALHPSTASPQRLQFRPPHLSAADERWELLQALAETIEYPPSAAHLLLLDHLAPAAGQPVVYQ